MNYIRRDIEDEFKAYGDEFPIVFVTGMRQCGKSTMLSHIANGSLPVVTLDDLQERALAQSDPQLFLQLHQPPIILDEVQYAPQLFSYLKIYADSHPDTRGAIWLSGSQPFLLMKLAGESLAGRVGIVPMLPLSQHELYGTGNLTKLDISIEGLREKISRQAPAFLPEAYERIFHGWMPAVASGRSSNSDHYYRSFVQTYIERDVRDLDEGVDILMFSRFMGAVAAHIAQLVNLESLSRDAGVMRSKVQGWLDVLQKSDIVFLLQPYSNNALNRAVKTPKLYFTDTGLAAWLGRWSSPQTLEAGALSGQIFENYVIAELRKTVINTGDRSKLWFYRDRDGREIDAVIERDGKLYPIEIKKSANPKPADIQAFSALSRGSLEVGQGMLVCMTQNLGALSEKCLTVPAWAL